MDEILSSRPDMPLVRHIAQTFDPAVARSWHRLPYCILPGDGFARYIFEHARFLMGVMPTIEMLPWDDVIFDFITGRRILMEEVMREVDHAGLGDRPLLQGINVPDRGRCWTRVATMRTYMTRREMSPWLRGGSDLLAPFRRDPDAWIAIESWESKALRRDGTQDFPLYPDVSIVPVADPWNARRTAHLYPNLGCRTGRAFGDGTGFCNISKCQWHNENDPRWQHCFGSEFVMATGVHMAICTLAYLQCTDDHFVEVSPARVPSPRERRHMDKGLKPWTDPRSYWILIDPQRAYEYGHPSKPKDDGGIIAGPVGNRRPHLRRGHWRHLRAEQFKREIDGTIKRIWVRRSWVGIDSWLDEGLRYQVVQPKRVMKVSE